MYDAQRQAGENAFRTGGELRDNPYSFAQGSPDRPLAIAWRSGFIKAQQEQEIAEDDANGDLFRGKVS